ncbi:Heat shock 22 kDa protein, mitochondrial [Ananas comosus]|uniref:Heat shock 22 kDa protein, mitochondrial n=1 Tax=Ananas comosus TaxID=4615 RepID=A0A199VCI7_ANACO|nr:Heat shock 22 kDa protein, mitochondrial [Ananas comosus]
MVNLNTDCVIADVFDPFNPTRSLSQVLNLMDQMLENPGAAAATSRGGLGGLRRGWDAKEDEEALYLRVDMPGLGKEHVKVWAEQNTLVIRGEGEKESEDDGEGGARRFSSRIDLPADCFKMDQIKAEMKNGVLRVVVPKAKEEDRKDVFHVNVE